MGTRLDRIYELMEQGLLLDEDVIDQLAVIMWRISPKGYVEGTIYFGDWRKTIKMHHMIVGTPLFGYQIDHDDRNRLNNRRSNLIVRTPKENTHNSGVVLNAQYISQRGNKFEVRMPINGVTKQIGTFRTYEEAVEARDGTVRSY